ncbi:hypothetical protein MTO96_021097 [Rhipicephalus appendiculatus]
MGQCVDGKCAPLNSKTRTTKQPGPPKETNPDCTAWRTNRTDNIFHTCIFTCEGDERVALSNKQSCVVTITRPPIDNNPDCNHMDDGSGEYIYQNCSFVCEGDEDSYLNNSEKCVLQGQSQVAIPTSLQATSAAFATGVCKEGQCVSKDAVLPPNPGGPRPPRRSPDCKARKNGRKNYAYRKCSFSCEGDEMVYLKRGEKCMLPKDLDSAKKGRRTRRKGICEKEYVFLERRKCHRKKLHLRCQHPPKDTNPDCKAVYEKSKVYVYRKCTFLCERDEEFWLKNNERCMLPDDQAKTSVLAPTQQKLPTGVCVRGNLFIPLLEFRLRKCSKGIGPTNELLEILQNAPSVVIFTLVFTTFAICAVHMQGSPESSDPNCNKAGNTNYVYTACTFTCEGDEIIVLQNNEKCYPPGGKGTSPIKNSNEATGQCIGDGRTLEKEEVYMLQARFVSKYDAKLRCPHGIRLFYSNKEAEAYNTQHAVQDVDAIHEINADDTIVGYRSDADFGSHKCVNLAKRHNHRAAGIAMYERIDGTTLLQRSIPYELNSLPQMSCGDACAVKTSHGFVVATVYISPGTSRNEFMNFLLHNLRAVCLQDVPVIVTSTLMYFDVKTTGLSRFSIPNMDFAY